MQVLWKRVRTKDTTVRQRHKGGDMRIEITQDDKRVVYEGEWETYDDVLPLIKSILEFMTFDAGGVLLEAFTDLKE